MLLQIETRHIAPDITVLTFTGKISLGRESQRIEMLVQGLLKQNERKLVFDLSGVGYIDSTGLGIITYCCGAITEAGGALRVAGASGLADRLFKMTKLDKILSFYPSVDDACQAFAISS